jgi:hypothetical protein
MIIEGVGKYLPRRINRLVAKGSVWLCAAVLILVAIGCSGNGQKTAMCAADAGVHACLTQQSTHSYRLEASGYQPNSELLLDFPDQKTGTSVPLHFHIGTDGGFSSNGGKLTLLSPRPITVTMSGTAGSGQAVTLSVVVRG